jgi:hypothetical protein
MRRARIDQLNQIGSEGDINLLPSDVYLTTNSLELLNVPVLKSGASYAQTQKMIH